MRRYVAACLFTAALLSLAPTARAVDMNPGDSCAGFAAGSYRPTGGPENPDGALVVCDGSIWQPILRYSSVGNAVMFASTGLAAAPLHVWGEAIIGSQGLACDPSTEGAIRYYSAGNVMELCDGSAWTGIGGGTISSIGDLSDATTQYSSANMFIGQGAGASASSNENNVAIGLNALGSEANSHFSTAVGAYAAESFSGGSEWDAITAFGTEAARNVPSGARITAIGQQALRSFQGNHNTAIGAQTLYTNNAGGGDFNTVMGATAGMYVGGDGNVLLGYEAARGGFSGDYAHSGNDNVIIGAFAARDMTGASNNNNVIIGSSTALSLRDGASNILIGQGVDVSSGTASNELNIGNVIYGTGMYSSTPFVGINYSSQSGNEAFGVDNSSFWNNSGATEVASLFTASSGGPSASNNDTIAVSTQAISAGAGASNAAIGVNSFAMGADDDTLQDVYGFVAYPATYANDNGYGLAVFDPPDAVGGTIHGVYINLDNVGVSHYGIYQESANDNYLAGNLGIGTTNPGAMLDVAGEIRFSSSGLACGSAQEGAVRYTGGDPPWEYCDGSAWVNFKQPRCQDDDTGECYLDATRSNDDPEFVPENIADGVNILGVTGTLTGGLSGPAGCANIGDLCADGTVFAGYHPITQEHLFIPTTDQGTTSAWKTSSGTDDIATDSTYDGRINTNQVANSTTFPAFKLCKDLGTGGHNDWYLPSQVELYYLWSVRGIIEAGGNITNFQNAYYWSSTEYFTLYAWLQNFTSGLQTSSSKDNAFRVRCVRR